MAQAKGWPAFLASRWKHLLWAVPAAAVVAVVLVFLARWWRETPDGLAFLAEFDGHSHPVAEVGEGIPVWAQWQHYLNFFFMVLIVRTGLQVRYTRKAPAFWTRTNKGLLRTKANPKKISIQLWLHNALDLLWVLNGIVFIVLLFVTDHWLRIVPTSWDVIPNAFSALVQYVSFDWPTENGWVSYNALQQLSYFGVIFILAPLAIITGVRMAEFWPANAKISKVYKVEWARAVHFPVMLLFVLFVIVHVVLVLSTGALRNLNHMFANSDDPSAWWGVLFLGIGLLVTAGAVIAAQPIIVRPIAALFGKVSR